MKTGQRIRVFFSQYPAAQSIYLFAQFECTRVVTLLFAGHGQIMQGRQRIRMLFSPGPAERRICFLCQLQFPQAVAQIPPGT